jgi:hypothetical protein
MSCGTAIGNQSGRCTGTSNGNTYRRSTLSQARSARTAVSIVNAAISPPRAIADACRSATADPTYGSAVLP